MCPCLTEELERKFYGSEPVFTWDPSNDTNRPVRGVHVNEIKLWPIYPKFVRETFEEAFSQEAMIGADTQHRVTEKKWHEVFTALRDCIAICSCGSETFIDISQPSCKCINCGKEIQRLPVMKVKKYNVVLQPRKKIYSCHAVHDSDDFKEVKGEIITSRQDPSLIGLRNDSDTSWTAILPNGASKAYSNGQVIKLGRGLKINFGNGNEAEII
ncbi:MAG: hypothetical protein K2N43_02020 [Lachnospiraceae bacterium]|nr:hypothetical protein [Lachnospiraceae bacterium]